MNHEFTMFIVDDTKSARILLESAFSRECRLESFAQAEDCLAHLVKDPSGPDIFLLDVDLPFMDGYTLCRKIKELPGMENVPVIFISSLDDLESRLEGFDAGGTDFMVKPYNLLELKGKVGAARRLCVERAQLEARVAQSQLLSTLVLSNMDQYALLITYLRAINDCGTPAALRQVLFNLMHSFHLKAAVQFRLPGLDVSRNETGECPPLEVAVINNLRGMDHIFEFKSRAVFNYGQVTLLVNNMPLDDPDLCGILRDNVAIATECANARLQALQTLHDSTKAKAVAAELLIALQTAVGDFEQKYERACYLGSSSTLSLLGELSTAVAALGMSDAQERSIERIVQARANDLADIYNFSGETQATLHDIAERLTTILDPAGGDFDRGDSALPAEPAAPIELF